MKIFLIVFFFFYSLQVFSMSCGGAMENLDLSMLHKTINDLGISDNDLKPSTTNPYLYNDKLFPDNPNEKDKLYRLIALFTNGMTLYNSENFIDEFGNMEFKNPILKDLLERKIAQRIRELQIKELEGLDRQVETGKLDKTKAKKMRASLRTVKIYEYFVQKILESKKPVKDKKQGKILKVIILAAGEGSRLRPLTSEIPKPLLLIGDKNNGARYPLIYYNLYLAGLMGKNFDEIRVLVVTKKKHTNMFREFLRPIELKNSKFKMEYINQYYPTGISDAFRIAYEAGFINPAKKETVSLMLADNIFYSPDLPKMLSTTLNSKKPSIFGYWVEDPTRFGVVAFDKNQRVTNIVEKPKNPPSHYMVPGLYVLDQNAVKYAYNVKPSPRGELEITSTLEEYMTADDLRVTLLPRDMLWIDAGVPQDYTKANNTISVIFSDRNKGDFINQVLGVSTVDIFNSISPALEKKVDKVDKLASDIK